MTAAFHVASMPLVSVFLVQMFVVGVLSVILCPVGQSALQDKVHWWSSLLYMANHVPIFGILGTAPHFVAGFWASFALMGASYALEKSVERSASAAADAPTGERGLPAAWDLAAGSASATPSAAAEAAAAYGFMAGEYGLFIFFLCGMTSGLAT